MQNDIEIHVKHVVIMNLAQNLKQIAVVCEKIGFIDRVLIVLRYCKHYLRSEVKAVIQNTFLDVLLFDLDHAGV